MPPLSCFRISGRSPTTSLRLTMLVP
ncbi:hypothetical protein DVH24_019836 [Malus domestica]|uniref:Uncharacterized protein n=1 Tax=Malus domestica TaxID=3750 RepID=A0A498HZA9_MALDO|nr:hypothetical protein DVH24_019836 [Malus domestica]